MLRDGISPAFIGEVRTLKPLALFLALKIFREPSTAVHRAILEALNHWVSDPSTHESNNIRVRWEALAALSETESSRVIPLVRKFVRDRAWSTSQALFRNGDVTGGLQICLDIEPGVGSVWRDRQIEHAKIRFGARLRKVIGELLQRQDLEIGARIGALRLAGYLADPQLAESIEGSWKLDSDKESHLGDYLWAAAQCCGNDPERFLGPVFDAWAALPLGSEKDNAPSPRNDLAAHEIRSAPYGAPTSAIGYFIKRAGKEDLRWPITYMIHGLDHPDAVEFVARELAANERRLEGTSMFSPFSLMAADEWKRAQEERGKPMSRESRDRLLALWQNTGNDKHLRSQAFRLWAATEEAEDLKILRAVDPNDSVLADPALRQRLVRNDQAAIPQMLKKLTGGDRLATPWHMGHWIWSDELTRALDEELHRRGNSVAEDWGRSLKPTIKRMN